MFIVANGSIRQGYKFAGPFHTGKEATKWGNENLKFGFQVLPLLLVPAPTPEPAVVQTVKPRRSIRDRIFKRRQRRYG